MARTMEEKIKAMEEELTRARTIERIYNEVKENMERVNGRTIKNPETGEWEYHKFTDEELETREYFNPYTGEKEGYIWDSKEEVKELEDIYKEVLEFLVKMA